MINRYELAMQRRMSSQADLRAFVLQILQYEGYDPSIVNFKEEGVTIGALNKLVTAVYQAGWKDGYEQYTTLLGERRKIDANGKSLEHHKRVADNVAKKNLINKMI